MATIFHVCLILLATTANCLCYTSTSTLPYTDLMMAYGEHDGSIYIIGGDKHRKQLTEYDIQQNAIIDLGSSIISDDTRIGGQSTQIGSILYMIDPSGDKLSVFDMQSKVFENNWHSVTFPQRLDYTGCLASTTEYLFVVGGYKLFATLDHLQTYDLSLQTWLSTVYMNELRQGPACLVHPVPSLRLYALGGWAGFFRSDFESIDIDADITQQTWQNRGNLITAMNAGRCVSYSTLIFCVGGRERVDAFLNTIQVIDPMNGDVVTEGDTLGTGVYAPAVVLVGQIIYVFGGGNARVSGDTIGTDIIQYCPLESTEPIPTKQPTPKPTPPPTSNPSPQPTPDVVTYTPTDKPYTTEPTQHPTIFPTAKPTSPSLLRCGEQLRGDYNDQAITFEVRLPYAGDLIFDASSSTFAIQSLTVVFGITPVASDMDSDGILTLFNAISADYTFAIKAPDGVYGLFDVRISCQSNHPTRSPSQDPTITPGSPTRSPTDATPFPTHSPTLQPSKDPTITPGSPTRSPADPTPFPTHSPTLQPSKDPTITPGSPTRSPADPTPFPTHSPTLQPSKDPTITPGSPTGSPTDAKTFPTQSPTLQPTESSTQPKPISCGDEISGSYNNTAMSVQVLMPYSGDLTFDASRSRPLTITSLSVVFGVTPIGFDKDNDGILILQDVIADVYTFTIIADAGPNQRYNVYISCSGTNPMTTASQFAITTSPTDVIQNTQTTDDTDGSQTNQTMPTYQIIIACTIAFVCVCVMIVLSIYLHKKHNDADEKVLADLDRIGFARNNNTTLPHQVIAVEMTDNVDIRDEVKAQALLDWFTHVVDLQQYFHLFMENGYDSFRLVKQIKSEQEIRNIGVKKKGHVSLIMSEIRNLQNEQGLCMLTKIGTVNGTDVVAQPTKKGYVSKCIDCLQEKQGRIYEEDGQFYCHGCWSCYETQIMN
eukprot:656475_1